MASIFKNRFQRARLFLRLTVRLLLFAAVTILLVGGLFYCSRPRWNEPDQWQFPVRGIDVSEYQGEINWPMLSAQDIEFAFIKATEGSGYTDPYFTENWENAKQSGLDVGAYHFFSFESSGASQARHFLEVTGMRWEEGCLPPVIDVELYGDFEKNPPDAKMVRMQLLGMVHRIEDACGTAPILYAPRQAYRLYLQEGFEQCDVWIRDVWFYPELEDGRQWKFWQFSDKGLLAGYGGVEPYIDLNLFYGSADEYAAYKQERCIPER